MISLLARLFIKNHRQVADPRVRGAYGALCSLTGIVLNVLLFAGKYTAGSMSGSVAVMADAFNNLSDAGSSLITLVGFKFAGKHPDPQHPFGHGRSEYLSGLIVSIVILLMGFELIRTSVEKILHPQPVESGPLVLIILAVSILVKVYMFIYNSRVGAKIASAAMRATGWDSLGDCIATAVVLTSAIVMKLTGVNIDGWCGALVSLFIFYAGIRAAKETMGLLLGQPPSEELINDIEDIVLAHGEIIGVHDLVVHDYGPGRTMISLHGEVRGDGDIYLLHDAIDRIEQELKTKLGCEAVIHMDPVAIDDELVTFMRQQTAELIKRLGADVTIHDFRLVPGLTHTNLIFDAVIPYHLKISDEQAVQSIEQLVQDKWPSCFAVVQIDRPYAAR